jgi:hypothetical protein
MSFTAVADCNHCGERFGPSMSWAPVFRHIRDKHPEIWDKDAELRDEAAEYGVRDLDQEWRDAPGWSALLGGAADE